MTKMFVLCSLIRIPRKETIRRICTPSNEAGTKVGRQIHLRLQRINKIRQVNLHSALSHNPQLLRRRRLRSHNLLSHR